MSWNLEELAYTIDQSFKNWDLEHEAPCIEAGMNKDKLLPTIVDKIDPYNRMKRRRSSLLSYTSLLYPINTSEPIYFESLPLLKDVKDSDRKSLLKKKLQQCCVLFNFGVDMSTQLREAREAKMRALSEILEYLIHGKKVLTEDLYPDITKMIAANIFRPIPAKVEKFMADPDEEEAYIELAWPHLQLVYEVLQQFLESPDLRIVVARKYIDQRLISQMIDLFDVQDYREREALRAAIHRIYGKFLILRAFIRKTINNILLRYIYEFEEFSGISELLEIQGSIISGFSVPLKEEHKETLIKILLPLHKCQMLSQFHLQLVFCVTQYLIKDETLTETVILSMLKFWPKTKSSKEVIFINEIEEYLETTVQTEFNKFAVPLFKQLAKCIASQHLQVAERALMLWSSDHVVELMSEKADSIMPIVFPSFYQATQREWSRHAMSYLYIALKVFSESNRTLFEQLILNRDKEIEAIARRKQEQMEFWNYLDQLKDRLSFDSMGKLPPSASSSIAGSRNILPVEDSSRKSLSHVSSTDSIEIQIDFNDSNLLEVHSISSNLGHEPTSVIPRDLSLISEQQPPSDNQEL